MGKEASRHLMTYSVGRSDPYTIMDRVSTESRPSVTDAPYPRVAAVGKLSVTAYSDSHAGVQSWDPFPRASAMANTTPLVTTVTKPANNPGEANTTLRVNIQEFYEEYYEDILPVIMEKVRHDRRKDVHTRINLRRTSVTGFPAQSISSSNTIALDSPNLLVLNTGASQIRQHDKE
nr:hypothetical protein [Tanacetum cinerariifolium]